ncbi:diguanylate cyclase domain-containing protein [Pectinatus brassicae]
MVSKIIIVVFKEQKNLDKIAQRIISNIGKAYRIRKNTINVSVSMGIAMYPYHGKDAMKLMKKADISMYNAKNTGKNRYVYYSDKTSTFA